MNPYLVFLLYLAALLGFVLVTFAFDRRLGTRPAGPAVKLERSANRASRVDIVNVTVVPVCALAIVCIVSDVEPVLSFIRALNAQRLSALVPVSFFALVFVLIASLRRLYRLLDAPRG